MHHGRRLLLACAVSLAVGAGLPAGAAGAQAAPAGSCPWVGSRAPAQQRADMVLAHMTLDDEIALVHGAPGSPYVGWVAPNPRLCIPGLGPRTGRRAWRTG